MEKVCPRCGAHFACSHDSILDCHCIAVPLDAAQLKFVEDNYDGCLCNDCLRTIQETFYSAGINPRYLPKPKFVKPNIYIWSEN